MTRCISVSLDGGSVLCGGPQGSSHAEHHHRETQLTVHVPARNDNGTTRAWLVPADAPHTGGWTDGTLSVVFHFDPELLEEAAEGARLFIAGGETQDPLIRHLGIAAACELSAPWHDRLFLGSVHQVLAGLLVRSNVGHAFRGGDSPSRLGPEQLKTLRAFVESKLDQTITVAGMARALGIGPQKLTRLLRPATGMSPHQYVTQLRLRRAKELLKHRRIELAEIAFRLGFASQSHFTAVFRRHVGVTPKAYRQAVLTSPR